MSYISAHYIHWFQGAFVYGILSYAVRTIPIPKNDWLKWIFGIIQYILAQMDKGQQQLSATNFAKGARNV